MTKSRLMNKLLSNCKKNNVKKFEHSVGDESIKIKFYGKCRHREKGVTNKNINTTKIISKGR